MTRNAAFLLVSLGLALSASGQTAQSESESPSVVQKVERAIARGAHAAASGVERGAKATARGLDRAASATAHGVRVAASGVQRGANATARGVEKAANKVTSSDSSTAPATPAAPRQQIRPAMSAQAQAKAYIASQSAAKQADMQALHAAFLQAMPGCKLWFLDGKNDEGKVVSNPNIGYGQQTMHLAGGKTREFYQIGLSGNTTGISVYIMGLEDKKYLSETYGKTLGKASVTGYCIKFKALKDIELEVLIAAVKDGASR